MLLKFTLKRWKTWEGLGIQGYFVIVLMEWPTLLKNFLYFALESRAKEKMTLICGLPTLASLQVKPHHDKSGIKLDSNNRTSSLTLLRLVGKPCILVWSRICNGKGGRVSYSTMVQCNSCWGRVMTIIIIFMCVVFLFVVAPWQLLQHVATATEIFLLLAMAIAKSVKCCRVSLPLI